MMSESKITNQQSKICLAFLAATFVLVIAGCSTPQSRIKDHPRLFTDLPPEVREKVREGRIEVGFPQPAVYIALGEPDRIATRVEERGVVKEVWSYTGYEREPAAYTSFGLHSHGFHDHGFFGGPVWVDQRREYEKLRIVFGEDGNVRSIERTRR